MNKRSFLKNSAILTMGAVPLFQRLDQIMKAFQHLSAAELARNEEFWARIREGYRLKPEYINLENGYYCFMPQDTLEHFIGHVREVNYQGSWYMRTVQFENKRNTAVQLARLAGCSPEELIITRNTTESLDTIISGFPWNPGDEAVMAEQDYGAMLNMFDQVSRRHGVRLKKVSVPMHPVHDEEIVELYEQAITARTKLLMVCHMINITGQILPIRKICNMAHRKGVEVMVDGAHAFAHIGFRISDLNCDYYGTSLHKWLSVPLGAGFLYVRKSHIEKLWPMFAEWGKDPEDIYKLNHTGTHPVHTDLAISNAIAYFERIGAERKEARLRYLQRYWTDQVRDLPHILLNTPKELHRSCAIANVGVRDMKPADLAKTLHEKYGIWTVAIDGAGVRGCRITPNVYTTLADLDALVSALVELG